MFYGFYSNIRKEKWQFKSLNTLGLGVYGILLILGMLSQYPFTVPRTSLFYCPIAFFLSIKGIGLLKNLNKYLFLVVQWAYIYFLIFVSAALSFSVFAKNFSFATALW
jgi:hypothetical protein